LIKILPFCVFHVKLLYLHERQELKKPSRINIFFKKLLTDPKIPVERNWKNVMKDLIEGNDQASLPF